MISYELAKKLKDAGYWTEENMPAVFVDSLYTVDEITEDMREALWNPSMVNTNLSELIEACVGLSETGDFHLERNEDGTWGASVDCFKGDDYIDGKTPSESVARLWLAIHSQPVDQQTD